MATAIMPNLVSERKVKYFQQFAEKYCPTVYDEISHYQPSDILPRPEEMEAFLKQSKSYQEEHGKDFYAQDFIKDYVNTNWRNQLYNRTNFERLYELFLENKDDAALRHALEVKMAQFKTKILSYEHPIFALQMDFTKYQFNDKSDLNEGDWAE